MFTYEVRDDGTLKVYTESGENQQQCWRYGALLTKTLAKVLQSKVYKLIIIYFYFLNPQKPTKNSTKNLLFDFVFKKINLKLISNKAITDAQPMKYGNIVFKKPFYTNGKMIVSCLLMTAILSRFIYIQQYSSKNMVVVT